MTYSSAIAPIIEAPRLIAWRTTLLGAVLLVLAASLAFGQVSASKGENTFIVENAPEMEIFAYGKTVIVRQRAKGVLAIGGNVIVEGIVDGDVAAIGGTVIQKEKAFIGGDVIVLGGQYKPESANPLRNEGRETVMYAGYEEELRHMTQNPSVIFAPSFSSAFLAQRSLSVLFWFLVSLGLTTIAPGAVSRAIARFNLSSLKVVGIGFATFLLVTITVIGSLSVLPNYLSAIFGLMTFVLLMLAYVFGRVALHVSVGKFILKCIRPEGSHSEALTILIGVVFWTALLSVPYVWTLALLMLFAAGIGLVLTARNPNSWRTR